MRCGAAAVLLALVLSQPGISPVFGQRLLTLAPEQSRSIAAREGSLAVASVASAASLQRAFVVQVDLELVRSGPPRLELPAPDGRVLVAERTAFEDRGGGAVTWFGRSPGAEYDSVVLTVAADGLVGRFGEPFGARYNISASAHGGGTMSEPSGRGFKCSLYEAPREDRSRSSNPAAPLRQIQGVSTDDGLKVLVLYTKAAAEFWGSDVWAYRHSVAAFTEHGRAAVGVAWDSSGRHRRQPGPARFKPGGAGGSSFPARSHGSPKGTRSGVRVDINKSRLADVPYR